MSQGEKPRNLTRQRIYIVIGVVVALGLAVMTIYSTLSVPEASAPTVEAPKP